MKNTQKVSETIKDLEELFNPFLTYQGNYLFPASIFYDNGKIVNGKNLAIEFFEKNYFSNIRNIFHQMQMTANPYLFIVSDINENGYGRSIKPALSLFVMDICHQITGSEFIASEDKEELIQQVKEYSRWFRKELAAISRNEMNSEREIMLEELSKSYEENEKIRAELHGNSYIPMQFQTFLEKKKDYIISLSFGIKSLVSLFDKPIDLQELSKCVDLDKTYLSIMKQLIETTKITIEYNGHVHNSLAQVATYISIVQNIRKNGKYYIETTTTNLKGQKSKYTIDDLIKEYNEIRLQNKDFEIIEIDETPTEDLRDVNKALEYMEQIDELIKAKELQASWNFIRNGNKELSSKTLESQIPKNPFKTSSTKKNYKKTLEERIESTEAQLKFLESTNYLYKMSGKNNFDGYIGYIYSNGTVIFEKFYRSSNSREPAEENATYIMTFNNFVEMSKKTKTEIMSYIKQGATDLRRIYHTSTWSNRILGVITGNTYNQEAMDMIDRLINSGQLLKKN